MAYADAFGAAGAGGTLTYYLATAFDKVWVYRWWTDASPLYQQLSYPTCTIRPATSIRVPGLGSIDYKLHNSRYTQRSGTQLMPQCECLLSSVHRHFAPCNNRGPG